jgi:uncharacterized protein YuzE
MKFHYYAETDSLYIDFTDGTGVDNIMITDDIVADIDASGRLIGLDVQHASKNMNLQQFTLEGIPAFSSVAV